MTHTHGKITIYLKEESLGCTYTQVCMVPAEVLINPGLELQIIGIPMVW